MKEEILKLRARGLTIAQIARQLGASITTVCEVIYEKNNEDIKRSSDGSDCYSGVF